MKMWWNAGVSTDICWPGRRLTVPFGGHIFIVHPHTNEFCASVSVAYEDGWPSGNPFGLVDDLGEPRCASQHEALHLLGRFLSAIAWVKNGGLNVMDESGAGCLQRVPWRNGPRCTDPGETLDYLPDPATDEGRIALALYREGLSVNSVPYQFLGFAKVLNLRLDGKAFAPWVNDHLDQIVEVVPKLRLEALQRSVGDVGEHLYVQGRCAVAHATGDPRVDPDNPADIGRLREELPIIQALARVFIECELGVNTPGTEATERNARLRAEHEATRCRRPE
jgi:hypothetical protein